MSKRKGPPPIVYIALAAIIGGSGFWLLKNRPSSGGGASLPTQVFQLGKSDLLVLGDTFSGYSTFRNAEFQSALADAEITLRYEDEFDQAARADRFSKGQADLMVTTLDQYLKHQPQGQIVGLIDRTVGADAVVLNTPQYGIQSINDLGKLTQSASQQGQPLKLVYAADTPSEYLANVLDIRFEGFNLADFDVIKVAEASEAWALMQDPSQKIAVAVLWEPFVTQAQKAGHTVALSSKDAPNAILDVMVAS
ncbi:MAG: hypothetical protein AAGC54_10965, partial [Cyanobacteria bacterium P01_F01_bin.4]